MFPTLSGTMLHLPAPGWENNSQPPPLPVQILVRVFLIDLLRITQAHTDDDMTITSVCYVLHWCKYRNVSRSFYWEGCGMRSCEAPSWTPICLFFLWSFLFSLEERLTVDFLDSKHDEVLMCSSLLDYLNAYLLILPWPTQLCPLAAVTFLTISLNL